MAVEIPVSVLGKVAEYLVAPIGRQFGYLFCYNRNIENMRSQVEKLKDKRLGVQGEVDVASRNCETIRADVTAWLKKVDMNEAAAQKIIEDKEKVGKSCLNGWCPNIKSCYLLSRKASKKTQNIDQLLAEGKFERVAYPPTPRGIVHTSPMLEETPVDVNIQGDRILEASEAAPIIGMGMPSTSKDDFGGFESRSLIMKDVMKAIKDDKVCIVAICGMGGVGKTTMAKEVIERVRKEGIFDEVVMVVVSQKPDLNKVQGDIADLLGLRLEEQNLLARADRLHKRLTQKGPNNTSKKILIILDDVWTRLDLEAVGIRSANDHNSCKILLTSREKDVCDQMRTDKTCLIEVLAEEEAWNLFQQTARIPADATDLFLIAEDIVKECGGLPIAITTIARVLENKSRPAWNQVLRQLKSSALEGEYAAVYATLQASYDFLQTEEIKYCFLLCCLFPEDFDIPIEDLVRYGVGHKMFRNIKKLHEARENAHAHVEMLRNSNLLLESAVVDCVKMHDLVRDFGLSIASEGQFLVRFGNGMKEWLTEDTYEQYTSISLQCDKMNELPDWLECPNLKLLQLVGLDDDLLKFPERFFEGMRKLQVLVLRRKPILSLPCSLQFLTTLRTLSINRCRLEGNVSIIGKLEVLEILSFAYSEIQDLPVELGKLSRLRLLDLTGSSKLHRIAPGLLSSLIHLEELYLRGSSIRWAEQIQRNHGIHGDVGSEMNASFTELKVLSNLVVIEIDIPDEVFPVDLMFLEKLEKFYVCVGGTYGKDIKHVFQNTLCCMVDTSVVLEGVFHVLCRKTEVLYLKVTDLKNLPKECEREKKLRDLDLISCDEMVSLVNTVTANAFRTLESLCLRDMSNLEHVCLGQNLNLSFNVGVSSPMNELPFFGNLRCLKVRRCHKLKSLLSLSVARGLINLKRLEVVNCRTMEEVFMMERGDEDKEAATTFVFPRLESLHLEHLPSLVGFCKAMDEIELPQVEVMVLRRLPMITSIYSLAVEGQHASPNYPFFNEKVKLNNMARLQLNGMKNLTEIWPAQFQYDHCTTKLERIHVSKCAKLLKVFPSNMIQGLQNLHLLSVKYCSSVEVIFDLQGYITDGIEIEAVLQLKSIHLTKLPKLTHVLKRGPLIVRGFHNLREIDVQECHKLENLLSSSIARGLVMLDRLFIKNCGKMDAIFWKETGDDEAAGAVAKIQFPHLKYLSLVKLSNLVQFCKSFEEVEFPQLEDINLHDLTKLNGLASKGHLFNTKLQNLQTLHVQYCGSIEVVFDLQRSNVNEGRHELAALTQLQRVYLWDLHNLRHVWVKGLLVIPGSFQNLSVLSVWNSNSLTYVFTPSTAKVLVGLQTISIHECKNLEEIVAKEEEEEECIVEGGRILILFPQLTSLSLKKLPKLSKITPRPYVFNWSSLEDLILVDCGKLQETVTDTLHQVTLDNMETLDGREINDMTVFLPKSVPPQLQNLKKIEIGFHSSLEVVFDDQGLKVNKEGHREVLAAHAKLEEVSLISLPKLRLVWRKGPHAIQVPFQNLSLLCVRDCHSLTRVFTPSMAKVLVRLQSVEIENCKNLKAIVAEEEEEEECPVAGGILFPQLTRLSLVEVPKLLAVTPKPYSFKWSSLKFVNLGHCGMLQETANDTLQVTLDKMESLVVRGLENLKVLFPTSVLPQLQNLQLLFLRTCSSLEVVFDLQGLNVDDEGHHELLATLLTQLTHIDLYNLPKLRHVWKVGPPHVIPVAFQNLSWLQVSGCHSLAHVLTPSVAKLLSGLQYVQIDNCNKLEAIVVTEDEGEGEEDCRSELGAEIILFPQLITLFLDLPNLLTITPKPYTLNWSSLKHRDVIGCHKLPDTQRYASGS